MKKDPASSQKKVLEVVKTTILLVASQESFAEWIVLDFHKWLIFYVIINQITVSS